MELKIEYIPTNQLKPYIRNAKQHTPKQIQQIMDSIQLFGMSDPIGIWKHNQVIEGHGRLLACQKLGFETIPVVRLDHLTDQQRRAYGIVHNSITMETGFDIDILNQELDKIQDIDMKEFGVDYDLPEVSLDDFPYEEPTKEKKKKVITCPYCGEKFEE